VGKIGLRDVRALQPGQTVWDSSVAGFGARRQRSEVVSYLLIYRTQEGRQRWHTIGRHGSPWTPETARAEAQRLLGLVVGGADPGAAKRASRTFSTRGEKASKINRGLLKVSTTRLGLGGEQTSSRM
jgi:hypothetical protein